MLSNENLTQLTQILLDEENTSFSFEFGYLSLNEYDLEEVARECEFTPEQIKALQEYGSNFIMIQTDADNDCIASCWESWVHNENTEFVDGLHSIWESEVQDVIKDKPFQICFNNEWVGTMPYSEELAQALHFAGVNKSISLNQQENCIEYVAEHTSTSISKETKNKIFEMYEMFKAMEGNA